MAKSSWDSYVDMNRGYNAFFDGWQQIQELLPSKTNREINMALSLLDSALDVVKANVKMGDGSQPGSGQDGTPAFEVFGGK